MASTFGGLTLYTERDGSTLPEIDAEAEIAETHIPGSNINVIDIGGLHASRIIGRIVVARADVGSWLAARTTLATLIVRGVSYGTCLLAQLNNHTSEISEPYDHFDVEWVIGS